MNPQQYLEIISSFAMTLWAGRIKDVAVKQSTPYICSLRIMFSDSLFLDIYYNAKRTRKDFALIQEGKRVFGIDNLYYWHVHPVEKPSHHEPIDEIAEEEILKRVDEAIKKIIFPST